MCLWVVRSISSRDRIFLLRALVKDFFLATSVLLLRLYLPIAASPKIHNTDTTNLILTCISLSTLMFIVALFTVTKIWKQPKWASTDEWMKKIWQIHRHTQTHTHTHTHIHTIEYHSARNKEWNNAIFSNIEWT